MTSEHPGIRPDSRLTADVVRRYLDGGEWTDRTLRVMLTDQAAAQPHRIAAIAVSAEAGSPVVKLTYAQLDEAAHRLAGGLRSLGVGPGDSVAVMLPNRIEFAVAIYAILELGAVYTGIPASYGARETTLILRRCGARTVLAASTGGDEPPVELIRRLRPELPAIGTVVLVGEGQPGPGERSYQELAEHPPLPADERPVIDPADLAHVGFTSGTTGEPKGVMNTHQTLDFLLRRFVAHLGLEHFGTPPVNLVASPIGHHTGFLWGVLFTAHLGGTAVYLDRWRPQFAARLIADHDVTVMFGAPTFLQDLLTQTEFHGRLPAWRTAVVAGAPVARSLADETKAAFGTWCCPAWGMTEWGIGISARPGDDVRFTTTDGNAVHGCDIRIVDADGQPVGPSETGRLQISGPGLFLGYLDRPDAMDDSFEGEWFDTGDLASCDADGFITLSGRAKDIVIRGGENIPVTEVESLIFEHPAVAEVAVVGTPDARLGERAVAVVVPRCEPAPTFEEVVAFLLERGLSKHFLPEGLIVVDNLPRTASGKIRKVEIRDKHADFFAPAGPAPSP